MNATAGPQAVTVRPMTATDAEAAAALSGELGYPVEVGAMRRRIETLTSDDEHGLFVATSGLQVVGWIHVAVAQHLQSETRAEIGGLVVSPDCRSAGVGARLVARAEQWARDRGLSGIVVRSQIKREAAHRFYLREGYTRTKTSAVFSKELR